MRYVLTLMILLIGFSANAMCLDDYDYRGITYLKNTAINTPYGTLLATDIPIRVFMNSRMIENENKKIDYLCKRRHGVDFSFANIMSHRTPSRSLFRGDIYVEVYNALRQAINMPIVWYSGNTISYACLRPNGKVSCGGAQ